MNFGINRINTLLNLMNIGLLQTAVIEVNTKLCKLLYEMWIEEKPIVTRIVIEVGTMSLG